MEYVYGAMLLHSAKKEISEKSIKKVLEAAGVEVDSARIKALVASLEDINIEEAINTAVAAPAAAAPVAAAPAEEGKKEEEKKEEEEEEEEVSEDDAVAGLGALFG